MVFLRVLLLEKLDRNRVLRRVRCVWMDEVGRGEKGVPLCPFYNKMATTGSMV